MACHCISIFLYFSVYSIVFIVFDITVFCIAVRYHRIPYYCSILLFDITVRYYGIWYYCIWYYCIWYYCIWYYCISRYCICISYNYSRLHCITLIPINVQHYMASMILRFTIPTVALPHGCYASPHVYQHLIPRSFSTL